MTEDRQGEPITVPLQQVHMLLAGRIPLLQFCRNFAWADSEAEMVNPFMERSRDGFTMVRADVNNDDPHLPLVTFHFARAEAD